MVPVQSARVRFALSWVLGLLATAAVAVLITHAVRKNRPLPTAPAFAVQPPAHTADVPLPSAVDSDARVREALSALTPRDLFRRWLEVDHLLDRLAVITVNVAEDQSPARELSFLQPSRPFAASRSGSELVISTRSHARYDAFANVISSLDPRRVATAYRTLHPLLESAYHSLGYPGRPLDDVVSRGLQRIVDAPFRDEVALHRAGPLYIFADARLESLGAVEKQLLRMGSRNTRLLQDEAREIGLALGFSLHGGPQAARPR